MKLNDICFEIPINQTINFAKNGTFNSSDTITFIDSWNPPLIFSFLDDLILCGPFVKIIVELSKRYGIKYVKA